MITHKTCSNCLALFSGVCVCVAHTWLHGFTRPEQGVGCLPLAVSNWSGSLLFGLGWQTMMSGPRRSFPLHATVLEIQACTATVSFLFGCWIQTWVLNLNKAGIALTTESTPSLLLFSDYFWVPLLFCLRQDPTQAGLGTIFISSAGFIRVSIRPDCVNISRLTRCGPVSCEQTLCLLSL